MSRSVQIRIYTAVLVALVLSVLCLPAAAQPKTAPAEISLDSYMALVRSDLRTEKRTIVTATMEFTAAESTAFWPIYDKYERDQMKQGDEELALIKSFAEKNPTLTDAQAKDLSMQVFALQKSRVALKEKYFKVFEKAIGAKKTARFFQVDNRLNLLMAIQIASEIPLVK